METSTSQKYTRKSSKTSRVLDLLRQLAYPISFTAGLVVVFLCLDHISKSL